MKNTRTIAGVLLCAALSGIVIFMHKTSFVQIQQAETSNPPAATNAAKTPEQAPPRASNFRFTLGKEYKSHLALLGTAGLGKTTTILDKSSASYCTAITAANTPADGPEYMGTDIPLTTLNAETQCKSAQEYSLAIIDVKVNDYKLLPYKKTSDAATISDIDHKIKNLPELESLKLRTQGSLPGDTEVPIASLRPTLQALDLPGLTVSLASYSINRENGVTGGPSFLAIAGKVYPLTGWCSYPYHRAFTLNGDAYIESGSYCCNCGITCQELFQIKETGPILVWEDCSYSD